jgi:PAS domain S-box-containing protein
MSDDPALAAVFARVEAGSGEHFAGYDPVSRHYFAAHRLEGPRWYFISVLPRAVIAREAFQHAQWILWTGGASLVVLLLLLAVTLRRGIARPLAELTRATEKLSEGETPGTLVAGRNDELGQLATAFNRMSEKIGERDAAMRELNADLERRIEARTAELQTSEGRVRAMLESTPGAIVVIDAGTLRFVAANEIAVRSLGLNRAHLDQVGPLDVSPAVQENGRPSSAILREAIQTAATGRMASFEWIHHGAQGGVVPCEVRLGLLPDSGGRHLMVATIIDISARRQAERRLLQTLEHERELNELKTNFVSMVSHEFRTPLGIISSSAEILGRYFDRLESAMRREHLDTIVRSTRLLSTMMEEVLLLGRFESGRLGFTPKALDLAGIGRALVEEVGKATDHACPIELRVAAGIERACSDEFLLRHIFTNLLSNAVKYSPAGSPVEFTITREEAAAVLWVRDHGIGIDPEDLRHLFQAFRRGRNVGARPGSGLGLVIVQRCVQLHGGEIKVDSEPGRGTTVTVRLPGVFALPAVAAPAASSERT